MISKEAKSLEDENQWDDPDLVPPPVFPTYDDENSQEMIVENNSSRGGTMMAQNQPLMLRSNVLSDDNNYMGGMGMIPESVFNTLSPTGTDSRLQTEQISKSMFPAKTQDSEEIIDETIEQHEEASMSKEQSPHHQNQTQESIMSSKKLYMDEITALIRKATSQTHMAVAAAELNEQRRKPFSPFQHQPLPTPHFVQSERMDTKPDSEKQGGANDQILADLDKIISNLEA